MSWTPLIYSMFICYYNAKHFDTFHGFFFLMCSTSVCFPPLVAETGTMWMAVYRPQPNVTSSGTLLLLCASQSKSNFPEMFSHHVDNQTLIASSIAYHSQTVTLNRQPMVWAIIHKYPTMNIHSGNRWFIVWADKRLSFPHYRPESVQADAGRPVQCFRPCFCAIIWETGSKRTSNLNTFIHPDVYCGCSASLSGQHCMIFLKVIKSQCANHDLCRGTLMCMSLNGLVSDSRELCRPTWQRLFAELCAVNGCGNVPDV